MSVKISLKMNALDQLLLKRSLDPGGKGQRFLTHEIRRMSDPYVPMDSSTLKKTAMEDIDHITYDQVYAKAQYYGNRGRGNRGARWAERMWADHSREIIKAVANYTGGHT